MRDTGFCEQGRTTTHPMDLVNAFLRNFFGVEVKHTGSACDCTMAVSAARSSMPGLLVWQGGTCVLVGDDIKLLEEMAYLVRKHISCKVAHGTGPKRPDGHHQPEFNRLPLQVGPRLSVSCAGQF